MSSSRNFKAAILCFCFFFISAHIVLATNVSYDRRAIIINGTRRILIAGSIHYPRSTTKRGLKPTDLFTNSVRLKALQYPLEDLYVFIILMWPDLIKKAKEGGLDVIQTYVFWNSHEPQRRQYDFSGDLDLIKFIKVIRDAGLYVFLRIGPYICGEWNYGGFPVWLHNVPGIKFRTDNKIFKDEMQIFTTLIVNMVKKEKLFASQGGPVILAQIENEYGDVISAYGEAGIAYRKWCIEMAESLNIGVPWVMCQDDGAPPPMINAHDGYYSDHWIPNNPNSPKIWAENWIGWYKTWGDRDPHRASEDCAFSTARFFQTGGTYVNYYMYHGGTNFGRTSGGPFITTSYDYDAPLNEYGQYNQPKFGHLKKLHAVLKSMEKPLTYGNVSDTDLGNNITATIYATKERSSCFLSNVNLTNDASVKFRGNVYNVPAWSVTILPDCKTDEFNTARVNSQTSVMVKTKDYKGANDAKSLKWLWRPERIHQMVRHGKGNVTAQRLMDQKVVGGDRSDYLWYMTNIHIRSNDHVWSSKNTLLRVNATGTIHAYVNGRYVGSKWGSYNISFPILRKRVKLHRGKKNLITLLSVTIGFQNYGPKFDLTRNGIVGPVELIRLVKGDDEKIIKNISNRKWTYKVGLDGFDAKFYDPNHSASNWRSDRLPKDRMMTWYKTTFKTPLGTHPVVVDLQGLGKGEAWVNGRSIGRYWPSFIAEKKGCEKECDYRGFYNSSQCLTNCGLPSQRWYHVPRSFMHEEGNNTLVLFEEFGGNPRFVHFRTVSTGKTCGNAYEKSTLELSCPGGSISSVKFASFGNPNGACGSFEKGTCEGKKDALSIIKQACEGKESCVIDVSENTFGSTSCNKDIAKTLAVEALC